MKNKDFERLLKQSLQQTPDADRGFQSTLLLVRSQAANPRRSARIPFRRFLWKQISCLGWQFWTAQGLMLVLFDRILLWLYGEQFWNSAASVARLLFCVSTLVAMMALPLLYRSRKYRMQEIESASYFSSARLLMARLTVIGIGDGLLLAGMFLMTMARTSMLAGNLTFYLLLPFLIMRAAYLYMMGHCSGNGFFIGSMTLGTGLLLFALVLPGRWSPFFRQSMTLGNTLLFLGLILFSAEQLRYLLHRSPYAELQVT